MIDDILDVPVELAEDAQALAKALVLSLRADVDRACPLGDRTSALMRTASEGEICATALYMVADIAQAAVALLIAAGIDVRDQLASPYLMPEAIL